MKTSELRTKRLPNGAGCCTIRLQDDARQNAAVNRTDTRESVCSVPPASGGPIVALVPAGKPNDGPEKNGAETEGSCATADVKDTERKAAIPSGEIPPVSKGPVPGPDGARTIAGPLRTCR